MDNVIICVPLANHTHPAESKPGRYFVNSLAQHINFLFDYSRGCFVQCNRNDLVKRALPRKNISHILFWDADIDASYHHILKLLSMKTDIASANHLWRGMPGMRNSISGYVDETGNMRNIESYDSTGIKEVDFAGTGFMLIKKSVFEEISYPWFNAFYDEQYDPPRFRGEDFYFCMKAKKAGFKIMVDYSCKLTH